MADLVTYEEASALLSDVADEAQTITGGMQGAAASAEQMHKSQQAYHQALGPAGADIDDDTLAATGEQQAATSAIRASAAAVATLSGECAALVHAALESLDAHAPLSEQVQAHGGAARMGFYGPS
jgi:hypothetical protein